MPTRRSRPLSRTTHSRGANFLISVRGCLSATPLGVYRQTLPGLPIGPYSRFQRLLLEDVLHVVRHSWQRGGPCLLSRWHEGRLLVALSEHLWTSRRRWRDHGRGSGVAGRARTSSPETKGSSSDETSFYTGDPRPPPPPLPVEGAVGLPCGWRRYHDDYGKAYWHHEGTGQTQWERPVCGLTTTYCSHRKRRD